MVNGNDNSDAWVEYIMVIALTINWIMNTAIFFLSTGRCGTQWIAANLLAVCKESAVVEHEPLHDRYYPRLMRKGLEQTGNATEIIAHCDRIEEVLKHQSYIECGWPVWGAIPYLLQRFEGRIRIVHLVRHPIPVACSWVSHRAFCPPLIPGFPGFREKVLASPFDEATAFRIFCDRWEGMNPFEKSMFFWLEVNALGLKLEQTCTAPWLRVRFEDLFNGNVLQDLAGFLKLPSPVSFTQERENSRDAYHYVCDNWWNPQDIQKYPEFIELALRLGYDPLDFDEAKLRRRYLPF